MKTASTQAKAEVKKHAKFSASSAARWISCPASIKLSENAPPSKSNKFSDEGTQAHFCLEELIKAGPKKVAQARVVKKLLSAGNPPAMIKHACDAADWIFKEARPGAEILSETKCKLDFIHEDMGGTTDCVIIEPYSRLVVIDFKYGVMPVDVIENPQLIAYALAVAHQYGYEFETVELVVIQPRALDVEDGGPIRCWPTDVKTLKRWGSVFKTAAKAAESKSPAFSASPQNCKYCPAAPICPELRDESMKAIQADFDNESGALALVDPIPKTLPIKNLGAILGACDRLETWIEKVRELAYESLSSGLEVPGYKLVQKRSTRKWIDEAAVEAHAKKHFGKTAFSEPELLSPAQFEKKTGDKAYVAANTISQSSGTTIAPESDSRPAYNYFEAEFKEAGAVQNKLNSPKN